MWIFPSRFEMYVLEVFRVTRKKLGLLLASDVTLFLLNYAVLAVISDMHEPESVASVSQITLPHQRDGNN